MSAFLHWALCGCTGFTFLLSVLHAAMAYLAAQDGDRWVSRWMAACSALFLFVAVVTGLAAGYLR